MEQPGHETRPIVVIGGGPAGLTAANELTTLGHQPLVLEKTDQLGGLARTVSYRGFHFDMGGHRFFTKVDEVRKLWHETLRQDFLRRPRLSRIYYRRRLFYYPLRPLNALAGLGVWAGLRVMVSYLVAQLFPHRPEDTFEHWVTNRFGKRLFLTFFKTYTEKVWGISCSELKAEWAAQRIKDLSLKTALLGMFLKPRRTIKTLIAEFDYPRLGPGMMWRALAAEIERRRGVVRLNAEVVAIMRTGSRIESVVVSAGGGRQEVIPVAAVVSSMPITELVKRLAPPPDAVTLAAADRLTYRDFLTVCLIVDRPHLFPDNWIYVHDPEVQVARIQNFKNWSPDMVPDPAKSSLGLEYFCTENDALWNTPDADLVELGRREIERLGLARAADVEDGCVFRVAKAYPVYDAQYREHLARLREFVTGLENLQTVGRNGLHRYNNQDHAMVTGMLAVRNLVLGERRDLWSVNTDQEYHEEVRGETEPEVHALDELLEGTLAGAFPRLDALAFGLASGITAGLFLLLVTLGLLARGTPPVLPFALLGQYFPGYGLTPVGSLVGLAYGMLVGFVGGFGVAFTRNAALLLSLSLVRRRAEGRLLRQFLDYL
jgi:protoporphyrinogen oxidase